MRDLYGHARDDLIVFRLALAGTLLRPTSGGFDSQQNGRNVISERHTEAQGFEIYFPTN